MISSRLREPRGRVPLFRLAYGESPYRYLMTRRIERAMALLRRGDRSVTWS
jgi:transcriptional regulator GlxA family with amidase domain